MVGDIIVTFIVCGTGGQRLELTREEAERLLRQLTKALKATGMALALWLLPIAASAGPITKCLDQSGMPITIVFDSATHIEVGVWHEDIAGCGATGASATTTSGPYNVQYFATGAELLTFYSAGFEACGRSQADVRWRDESGQLYRYADFIVNAGVDCAQKRTVAYFGGSGEAIVYPPDPESPRCADCTIDPRTVPVPEPGSYALFLTGLTGLASWSYRRVRRG